MIIPTTKTSRQVYVQHINPLIYYVNMHKRFEFKNSQPEHKDMLYLNGCYKSM